ncbi:MAG TPA: hypothetical protein VHI71_05820 [Actinomycetota bacterium]|nr:hypothetical protein [Actinomycetota bacterium]
MRRHRRTMIVLATLAVVAFAEASLPAGAAGGRGLSLDYTGPATGVSTPRASYLHDACTKKEPAPGCVVARIRPGDRFVAVGVYDDAGGRLVGASVWVESADGHFDILGEVCGDSMEVPFQIPRGYDFLEVHVSPGTCGPSTTPSVVTKGIVNLWLSARRFG